MNSISSVLLLVCLTISAASLQYASTDSAISLYGRYYTQEKAVLYDWCGFKI